MQLIGIEMKYGGYIIVIIGIGNMIWTFVRRKGDSWRFTNEYGYVVDVVWNDNVTLTINIIFLDIGWLVWSFKVCIKVEQWSYRQ